MRLALAQAAADKTADTRVTLDRFVEVERRFPSFAQANLQPEVRSAFKTLLLARIPQATILGVPSLSGLIETEEQKIAKLPPAERRKALEAAGQARAGQRALAGGPFARQPPGGGPEGGRPLGDEGPGDPAR